MTNPAPAAAAEPPADTASDPLAELSAEITAIIADYRDLEIAEPPIDLQAVYLEDQAREDANRLLWILGQVETEKDTCARELTAEVARIKMRQQARLERLERRASWLTSGLEHLFRFLPIRGKAKSLTLLRGQVGHRQGAHAGIVITQEPAAIVWAKQHAPEAVTTIPATDVLDRDILKQAVLAKLKDKAIFPQATRRDIEGVTVLGLEQPDADGELRAIDGLFYKPAVDRFYAKPAERE